MKLLPLRIAQVEIFPGLYNFSDAHAILVVILLAYTLNIDVPPSNKPTIQFMSYFWWETICIVFTLGNWYTSSYTPHATYGAFLLRHLGCIYFRQQVNFLLCHPYNLCDMTKGSSNQYTTMFFLFTYFAPEMLCFFCIQLFICILAFFANLFTEFSLIIL